MIFLRPNLSDNLPAIGEKISCVKENAATIKPTILPLIFNSVMYVGMIGMTRPIPVKIINMLIIRSKIAPLFLNSTAIKVNLSSSIQVVMVMLLIKLLLYHEGEH
ncbi:hypothetical protein D3C81_1398210 [compost metagenome]